MIRRFLLSVIWVGCSLFSSAQPYVNINWFPDFQQDVMDYFQENVQPEITRVQAQVEAGFSEQEKKELTSKRLVATEIKVESRLLITQLLKSTLAGADRSTVEEQYGEQVRNQFKNITGLIIDMDPMLSDHRIELQEALEEIGPKVVGWQEDIRNLRRQYASDEEIAYLKELLQEQLTEKGYPELLARLESLLNVFRKKDRWRPQATFLLLLDLNEESILFFHAEADELALISHALPVPQTQIIRCYPNPAGGIITIEFELAAPTETLTFEVTDLNGKVLFQHQMSSFPAGRHSQQVDTQKLTTGTYLLNLRTPNEVDSQKLIIGERP